MGYPRRRDGVAHAASDRAEARRLPVQWRSCTGDQDGFDCSLVGSPTRGVSEPGPVSGQEQDAGVASGGGPAPIERVCPGKALWVLDLRRSRL
jgi:hypothetical protein